MRFDEVVELLGAEPWFDLATVTQLVAEPRVSVVSQLHRWGRAGKVVALRRGRYTLADRYRRAPLAPATLANVLYAPSYLSGAWTSSFYRGKRLHDHYACDLYVPDADRRRCGNRTRRPERRRHGNVDHGHQPGTWLYVQRQ